MITAIVLLNVERAQIKSVSQTLVDLPEVSEVFSVAGRFDLVCMIRVKSMEAVADTMAEKIGALDGITATETLIAFRTYSRHDLEHMFSLGT